MRRAAATFADVIVLSGGENVRLSKSQSPNIKLLLEVLKEKKQKKNKTEMPVPALQRLNQPTRLWLYDTESQARKCKLRSVWRMMEIDLSYQTDTQQR